MNSSTTKNVPTLIAIIIITSSITSALAQASIATGSVIIKTTTPLLNKSNVKSKPDITSNVSSSNEIPVVISQTSSVPIASKQTLNAKQQTPITKVGKDKADKSIIPDIKGTIIYRKPVRVAALITKTERAEYRRMLKSIPSLEIRRHIMELTFIRLSQRAWDKGMVMIDPIQWQRRVLWHENNCAIQRGEPGLRRMVIPQPHPLHVLPPQR